MNPLNYASLETSKRLVDAGIVLETDFYYLVTDNGNYIVKSLQETLVYLREAPYYTRIPAPGMAEVWRALPAGTTLYRGDDLSEAFFYQQSRKISKINSNPTDALSDLLIWVREAR